MPDSRSRIEDLVYTYAERMDAGDLAGVGRLFEHGHFRAGDGPALTGAQLEQVNRELVILYEDGTPRTRHLTTNLRIEVDEATGSARCHSLFTVIQGAPGAPLQPIVAGRYEDRFERVDRGWRFSERRVHVDLVGDLSRHLRTIPSQIQKP